MRRTYCTLVALILLGSPIASCGPAPVAAPPTPPAPTAAPPSVTPEPTPIPTPTPIPGSLALPLESLGDQVPWLPLDKANTPASTYAGFNTAKPPFNSVLVRKALSYAIDRTIIARMALKYGYRDSKAATTFTPPQTLGRDLYGVVGANFDPEKAKALLLEAGYSDSTSFPKVLFLVNATGDVRPGARFNMAKEMARMWKEHLGIDVQVDAIGNWQAYLDRLADNPPEIYWSAWAADYNDPKDFLGEVFTVDDMYHGEINWGKFENPEYSKLIDRASSGKPAARQALYIEAERILCETEAAIIPLYFYLTKS